MARISSPMMSNYVCVGLFLIYNYIEPFKKTSIRDIKIFFLGFSNVYNNVHFEITY